MVCPAELVTWTCVSGPCQWGASPSGYALAWPAEWAPATEHAGYTASAAVYLPAENAVGLTITLTSGSATIFAGDPGEPVHRVLAVLGAGETYTVDGIEAGEVLSVETATAGAPFTFELLAGIANAVASPDGSSWLRRSPGWSRRLSTLAGDLREVEQPSRRNARPRRYRRWASEPLRDPDRTRLSARPKMAAPAMSESLVR